MSHPAADPVLQRFRAALFTLYGERLERAVLYGSHARRDSDYDMAVFLNTMPDRWEEMKRPADLRTDVLDDTGEFVHASLYRAGAYNEPTPLRHEIRSDGLDL